MKLVDTQEKNFAAKEFAKFLCFLYFSFSGLART